MTTSQSVQKDIAGWRSQLAFAAKRGSCSLADAEPILTKYQAGSIDRGTAALDVYNLIHKQPLKSASVALPAGYKPPTSDPKPQGRTLATVAPSAPRSGADPDDADSIFASAGYGQQSESESAKVATILQHHREITGASSRRNEEVVEDIFQSAGYPPKGTTPVGNLTADEQAHVGRILANQYAVTGIKSRSQTEQDRADAEVVDRVFQSAGYPPKAQAEDPIVQRALANQRAVIGR